MNLSLLLAINSMSTCYMTGVIWFVQIVHHPSFELASPDSFSNFATRNAEVTTWMVGPFSGLPRERNMKHHEDELREYLKNEGLKPSGEAARTFYNPPWAIPFLRRNEVRLPVELTE
jgi:hypothetical protein